MKKRFLLLSLSCLALSFNSFGQLNENFESTSGTSLPTGWTGTAGWVSGTSATLASQYFAVPAHTRFAGLNDDADSASNNLDAELKTPVFSLSGLSGAYLSFDMAYLGGSYNNISESFIVKISTNGGTSWSTLQTMQGNQTSFWETQHISLASYDNMSNLMLAFVYSDGGSWEYGVGVDNVTVSVPATNDLSLDQITPTVGSPSSYGLAGSSLTLGGTVTNNGLNTVTSFNFNYQIGSNAVVSTPISSNIAAFASYSFTVNANFPSTVADYPVHAWVSLAGDVNPLNDSNSTAVSTIAFMPVKRLLVEEATGTWCGWCVRGIVFMDSLQELYGNGNVSLVAVHDNDPMAVTSYDQFISGQIQGYPSVVIDRREVDDPQNLLSIYNSEHSIFGYADMYLTGLSVSGNNVSANVNVIPAINMSGDYRLALVITEDNVHSTAGGTWDQHNYYSYQSQNQALTGQGVNYQDSAAVIPSSSIYYNFVARSITPSETGASGVLPATMNANTAYSATLSATLDPSWNTHNLRGIIMLIRNSDGVVLNTVNTGWPLGVSNVNAGISKVMLFPNPANDIAYMDFSLEQSSQVNLTVTDAVGRTVYTAPATQMAAGQQRVTIPTNTLAAGVYNVTLSTETGNITQRLSVVK